MNGWAAILLLGASSWCGAAAPTSKTGLFKPTSPAWVGAFGAVARPGLSSWTLLDSFPGLRRLQSAPELREKDVLAAGDLELLGSQGAPELRVMLGPLVQELEKAGYSPDRFASEQDKQKRDQALKTAWAEAELKIVETLNAAAVTIKDQTGDEAALAVDTARLHNISAYLSQYLPAEKRAELAQADVNMTRNLSMADPETVRAAMERIAEALGRTPAEMAVYDADWMLPWDLGERGDFAGGPGQRQRMGIGAPKEENSPSLPQWQGLELPAHASNPGLTPFGSKQLVLRFAEAVSGEKVTRDDIARFLDENGLRLIGKLPGGGYRVAVIGDFSIGQAASRMADFPGNRFVGILLSATPTNQEPPKARQVTVRFNETADFGIVMGGVSSKFISQIVAHPALQLVEALPGRTYRLAIRDEFPDWDGEKLASQLQSMNIVTYAIAHSNEPPRERQLLVRFKRLTGGPLGGNHVVADHYIGKTLGKLKLQALEALPGNVFRVALPALGELPDTLAGIAEQQMVLSATPLSAADGAEGSVVVHFGDSVSDDAIAGFFRRHRLLVLDAVSYSEFRVAPSDGMSLAALAKLLSGEPEVARVYDP